MAIPSDQKPPLRAAAGGIIPGGNPARADAIAVRKQDWQRRVLAFADSVPEVAAAGAFVHSLLDRVEFYVEGLSPERCDVLNRQLKDFPSGRVGEGIFYTGEMYVSFEYDAAEGYTEWKSYGHLDYENKTGKPFMVKGKNGKMYPLEQNAKAFRIWRQSRSDWRQAWSPHLAALDLMEAMYLHQLADTAVATSRLASAGILVIPTDMKSIPVPDGGRPEPGSREEFQQLLSDAMTQSVRAANPQNAVVPLMYFADPDWAQGFKHILMERKDDAEAFAARMKSYSQRYATGIDLPPEIILGMGTANHWSAWKVDQNTWTYFGQPQSQLHADALLQNFAKPFAELMGWPTEDLKVCVSGKHVVAKPDKTDAAIKLAQLGILKKESVALACGFELEDVSPIDFAPIRKQLDELPAELKPEGPSSNSPAPPTATG